MTGCFGRRAPVYTPQNAVSTATGAPLSVDSVRQAIVQGCLAKGWAIDQQASGIVRASVYAGGHSATVQIHYNSTGYVIQHVQSSPGLKFDGHYIHRRYNHWVRLLDESIKRQLLAPAPPSSPSPAARVPVEHARPVEST